MVRVAFGPRNARKLNATLSGTTNKTYKNAWTNRETVNVSPGCRYPSTWETIRRHLIKTMFKIRDYNGYYSTKGNCPCFTERGEIFWTPEAVSEHLKNLGINGRLLYRTMNVKLVEFHRDPNPVNSKIVRMIEKNVFDLV